RGALNTRGARPGGGRELLSRADLTRASVTSPALKHRGGSERLKRAPDRGRMLRPGAGRGILSPRGLPERLHTLRAAGSRGDAFEPESVSSPASRRTPCECDARRRGYQSVPWALRYALT